MTSARTHIFRLLKWGRTLAKHGALRDLEKHKATPPQVRRLFRLARIWTFQPKEPNYSAALQAIGPAAIKLGQTLATRPDVIGEAAARDLLQLQDSLPPVPFDQIRDEIELSLGKPLDELYSYIDPDPVGAASIAQVHRATTLEGKDVAVKVLRPGIIKKFNQDIETYEWAAAQLEAFGGEAKRLRPQLVIANFRRWTMRELDLRREAASASELAEHMAQVDQYEIPAIDWDRTSGRVLTLDWVDGIKISNREALVAAGHDLDAIANRLVHTFLKQAIEAGYFHADMHQGNLFVKADGTIVAIDFGIMGRINKKGDMLDGLFAITRDFDMETQPHLLLLQKTMVMVEGIATDLNPTINMWDASGPYVKEWIRGELGPEAAIADRINADLETILMLPDIVRRLDAQLPRQGGAPPPPPVADVELILRKRKGGESGGFWRYTLTALLAGGAGATAMFLWG